MSVTSIMRTSLIIVIVSSFLLGMAGLGAGPDAASKEFHARLRSRVQPFKFSDTWEAVTVQGKFATANSAILICDMWDKHWCRGASRRVDDLARRMDPVLQKARTAGVLVIHSPSDTMTFYKDYP
jgi:hypothetical protein